ncbi:MAG: hemolysin family protein [Candidatus Scatovivens sp.]
MTQLIILIILIFLNAFFAAAEIAFISLNDAKIDIQAKEGNKKAISIQKMLKNPSKFLATIQIGITLAGFLSSAFASNTFASKLAGYLYNISPYLSFETWNGISMVLITIVLSYFSLIFGELVPKRIAMKNYEKLAFATIGIIKAISILTAPFVRFLTFSTNIVSKLFGVEANDEQIVTEEEIRMMVDVGQEKGNINIEEKKMINNVFEFNDRIASEIMVHRTNIVAVDINMTISEVIEKMTEDKRYSRIPVYEDNIDEIKGIVYLKDILLSNKNKNTKIKSLVKDAYFVPETKLVNELFEELRKNKKQIAIVIDEYGGTAGLVTMEDILEEIVGEIYDEYDKVENKYEKINENTFIFEGENPIYEVEKILDIKIPEGDYDTLSGYLLENLERIPNEKEKPILKTEKAIFKVEECKENKILKVKIKKR